MSDDGIFDEDVQKLERRNADTQPTQQIVTNFMQDIFGDDDDSDAEKEKDVTKAQSQRIQFDDVDDDIFADSDDEKAKPKGRLMKKQSFMKPKSRLDDGLLDSDDEEVNKAVEIAKKRKLADKNKKANKRLKKRSSSEKVSELKTSSSTPGEVNEVSSGDEYDSGEDAPENEDDRRFIDKNDEFGDLLKEYNADNQNFDDERPSDDEGYGGGSSKKKSKKSSSAYSDKLDPKATDPLSMTLMEMKNPKIPELAEKDKEQIVEKLQKKMAQAVKLDNIAYAKHEPALHKLKLLPTVMQFLNKKALHNTLLERDILCDLRDWIEPRDNKTLPSLEIRSAIYERLLRMACTPEHLKRTNSEKPPIGATIVALRKHKMETVENKRILKDIMDKWSRPIFGKSVDARAGGTSSVILQDSTEVREMMMERYLAQQQAAAQHNSSNNSSSGGVKMESILAGGDKNPVSADFYSRARTPYSQGFLFTVQPELKSIDKTDIMEKTLGEGRMKLFKKMSTGRSATSDGLGKKSNPRAMDLSVSSYK